jgi:hypothetical protein
LASAEFLFFSAASIASFLRSASASFSILDFKASFLGSNLSLIGYSFLPLRRCSYGSPLSFLLVILSAFFTIILSLCA